MRALALVILASCSCATAPKPPPPPKNTDCMTSCGLSAQKLPPGWTCETLQKVERRVLYLARALDVYNHPVCDLRKFTLYTKDVPEWDYYMIRILGITECKLGRITIGNQKPSENALAHELFHALQDCDSEGPIVKGETEGHSKWKASGIYTAIKAVERSLLDEGL